MGCAAGSGVGLALPEERRVPGFRPSPPTLTVGVWRLTSEQPGYGGPRRAGTVWHPLPPRRKPRFGCRSSSGSSGLSKRLVAGSPRRMVVRKEPFPTMRGLWSSRSPFCVPPAGQRGRRPRSMWSSSALTSARALSASVEAATVIPASWNKAKSSCARTPGADDSMTPASTAASMPP